MSAILFGSISTIADTSEMQREAFNRAFQAHGLAWRWEREDYVAMLQESGGQQRIADYAASLGDVVDAAAIHQTKSEIFQKNLATSDIEPRQGVIETIRGAKSNGLKVALVTTTSPANIAALSQALRSKVPFTEFDLIVDADSDTQPKPDKASFAFALHSLGEKAADCLAIEDNVGGVQAAVGAGLRCIAFPNENTAHQAFDKASESVDQLNFQHLQQFLVSAA